MIIRNGKTISSIFKGDKVISAIYKGATLIYEAFKNLINVTVSGILPLTLTKSAGEDLVDYKMYGNSVQHKLPNQYQQVEYIESTGTQFFDTGVKANNNTRMVVDFKNTTTSDSGLYMLFGARNYYNNSGFGISISSYGGYVYWGNYDYANYEFRLNTKIRTKYDISKNGAIIGDTFLELPDTTFTGNYPITIFSLNSNTGYDTRYAYGQLYSSQIYDNDVLVRDFVPCYRKSDNVVGLYDIVNDVFYENIGTGELLKGNNATTAPTPEAPIEVESVGNKTKNVYNYKEYPLTRGTYITYKTGIAPEYNPSSNYACTLDFIPIEPNTTYTLNYASGGNNPGIAFYSETNEESYISGVKSNIGFTTPNGANFVRFTVPRNTDENTIQLEKSTSITDYEPYGYKIPVKVSGRNLLNPNSVEDANRYITAGAGTFGTPTTNWRSSDFILVTGGKVYHFNAINSDATSAGIAWYNDNKKFISGETAKNVNANNGILTAPSNAKYLRVSWRIDEGYNPNWQNTVHVVESTKVINFQPYEEIITNIYINEPLREIADYTDYIDFENSKVVRYIYNEFLTKVRSKSSSVSGVYSVFFADISKKPYSTNALGFAMSNKFERSTAAYGNLHRYGGQIRSYVTQAGVNVVAYTFDDTSITTVEQAQEKIGDGFDVNYVLASPIEEAIELPNIPTLKGATILEVDTETQPSNMEAVYVSEGVEPEEPEPISGMTYKGSFPTTYKDEVNGDGTITSTSVVCQSRTGKFIAVQGASTDASHPIYLFMLTDDGYVQVTHEAEKTYTAAANYGYRTLANHPQILAYDEVNKRLFIYTATAADYNSACKVAVYDIDEDIGNAVLRKTFSIGGSSSAGYFWGYNLLQIAVVDNNVFLTGFDATTTYPGNSDSMSAITKQYYYDAEAGTLTYIRYLVGASRPNKNYAYALVDMSTDTSGALYVAYTDAYANRNYIQIGKMVKDDTGVFQYTGSTISLTDVAYNYNDIYGVTKRSTNMGTAELTKVKFSMLENCSGVFYVSKNGGLKYYTLDTEAMTKTEQTPVFADGLDVSTVTKVKAQKTDFLYVISSAYDTAEQLRLYKYNAGTWELFKLPMKDVTPALSSAILPANNNYDFVTGKTTTFAESTPAYYDVNK
jgi:hypothetical protein